MIRKVLVVLAFGFLGPAVGNGQQAPVSVAVESLSTAKPAETSQQSSIDLEDLVREALQKNPAVQSALHTVEAQRRRVPQAKALPDPTVGDRLDGQYSTVLACKRETRPAIAV